MFIEPKIVFMIVSASITFGLTRGALLDGVKSKILRNLPLPLEVPIGKLLYCSQCLGFWVGIICWTFMEPDFVHQIGILDAVASAFASSAASSLLDRVMYGPPSTDDKQ